MITGQVTGKKVIINNQPADVSELKIETSADLFYEVIRLMNGKALFLPDHLRRLKQSVQASETLYPGEEAILSNLHLLLEVNQERSGNIKISLFKGTHGKTNVVVHFVSHFYPSEDMYQNGVKLLTFEHTRPHPGVKKWDGDFRKRVNEFIDANRIYEAVLINSHGMVTEGSRSNVFFINAQNHVIPPPAGVVLQGITRKYVLEITGKLGISCLESEVPLSEISSFQSCFITGTSPGVLPVKSIDRVRYDPQNIYLTSIMQAFNLMLDKHKQNL